MELYLNVYGDRYRDDEPCFLSIEDGTMVWNRITRDWVTWESLEAYATKKGHTWQPREIGIPSIKWQLSNSINWGQVWAPGLDDTTGLGTEAVTNGEDWSGASGSTPPTGWTSGGNESFNINAGHIEMTADPVLGGVMSQTLSGNAGEYYILEMAISDGTTADASLILTNMDTSEASPPLTIGPVSTGDQARSVTKSLSFMMPSAGMKLDVVCAGGGFVGFKFIRCYQESELTGNPGSGGSSSGLPSPLPTVHGPYGASGTEFWIRSTDCMIGFNVDSDTATDIWMTGQEVCDSDIDSAVKMAINARLTQHGCNALPCAPALMQAKAEAKPKAAPKAKKNSAAEAKASEK